jgi:hypothetical protein
MEDQETIASSLTSDDDNPSIRNHSDNNQLQNSNGEAHARAPPPTGSIKNGQNAEVKDRPPVPSIKSGGLDKSQRSASRRDSASGRASLRVGPKLSWKSDPRSSFSDWRIEVFTDGSAGSDMVYPIHRNICGFGPRKSEFLVREFMQRQNNINYQSDGANTTELELPASQANAFPMALDFMYYTHEAKQALTAERACAVFKLSEILDMPALQNVIVEFYRKNVTLKNMGEFVSHAEKVKADRLLLVAKAKIGSWITEKPELAGLLPPNFLCDVLSIGREQLVELRSKNPKRYSQEMEMSQSRHWSKAAYICVSHNEKITTAKLFEEVFSEDLLPYIDSTIALRVLALEFKIGEGGSEYTSLQRRCVSSIAEDWASFQRQFQSPEAVSNALTAMPSHVLADILVKSMNK